MSFTGLVTIVLAWMLPTRGASAAAALQPKATPTMISTVKNFRPVSSSSSSIGSNIYRSACLDNLSVTDAQNLLDGSVFLHEDNNGDPSYQQPLAAVIDLRNADEIRKSKRKRSESARWFYSSLVDSNENDNTDTIPKLLHIPILQDVDAFWDEAIRRMDATTRAAATLQTVFRGGALDRAAARSLEQGGLSMLYTVMMTTAQGPFSKALRACVREAERGPVLVHCQKGKDRTGVLAMLLQHCLGETDDDIIKAYSLSGELLGGEDAVVRDDNKSSKQTASTMVDWSHFRGSPPLAMVETLEWTRQQYGSVNGYLDAIDFDSVRRENFREKVKG